MTLDKRLFTIKVMTLDATGAWTGAPVALQATLVYEDGEALAPEVRANALSGNTATTTIAGAVIFRLSPKILSSQHQRRRFRVRIAPQDAGLAHERLGLVCTTEDFFLTSSTTKGKLAPEVGVKRKISAISALGLPGAGPAPTISKFSAPPLDAAPSGGNGTLSTASLQRRRYFGADAVRAATAPSPGSISAPLTRSGVAAFDRLAAIVAQQLTTRAWQRARRQRVGTHLLRPSDVVAIVKRSGTFDCLYEAGVVREWEVDEPLPSSALPPGAAFVGTELTAALPSPPPGSAPPTNPPCFSEREARLGPSEPWVQTAKCEPGQPTTSQAAMATSLEDRAAEARASTTSADDVSSATAVKHPALPATEGISRQEVGRPALIPSTPPPLPVRAQLPIPMDVEPSSDPVVTSPRQVDAT